MRNFSSSGLRTSIGAAAAVALTALTVLLFESPVTAWGTRTQPSVEIALSVPAIDRDTSNV